MSVQDFLQHYGIVAAMIAYFAYRFFKFRRVKGLLGELERQGAQIVDVRSPSEFASGSNPRSVNIPLDQLRMQIGYLDQDRPVVLCCASGARSGMAAAILKENGFKSVHNAGPWTNTLLKHPGH